MISIYCVVRCILFPGSKIVVAAGQKSQAQEVLVYIDTMRKGCPNLDREIESCKPTSSTDPTCHFHNGSWIRVVAATDGARSKRANILIVDEFRMVKKEVVDKVLRKFLSAPRQPKYLNNPKYRHLAERNKEYYLSSCWYKSHWSWDKIKAYFKKLVGTSDTDKKEAKINPYFMCGLPYQLAISENLLMQEQVLDEMSEDDFDPIGWEMEMGCKYFGESEKAYFKFEHLSKNRNSTDIFYPKEISCLIKDKNINKIPKKKEGEIRIISNDIATIGRDQNDASAYVVLSITPNKIKTRYRIKLTYMESLVGGHTELQAIRIRQLYDDFDCDYIVIDTMNAGVGVYDQLCKKTLDNERGVEYGALTCMNDKVLEDRCWEIDAPKVIYAIKGNPALNDQCARKTRNELITNNIDLPLDQNDAKVFLKKIKGYDSLPMEDKAKLELPYMQTSSLVNEMINLSNEGKDGIIKLKEPRTGRKDKYSAFSYGIYFIKTVLEKQFLQGEGGFEDDDDPLVYY